MAETVTKSISFPALLSAEVRQDASHSDNVHSNLVSDQTGGSTTSVVVLESNFEPGYSADFFFPATKTNITVTKVELEFWHYQADLDEPIKSLDFVAITDSLANGVTNWATQFSTVDTGVALVSKVIHGIGREKTVVNLGSTIATTFTTRIKSATATDHIFNVGIRRTAQTTTETGSVYIGGPTLLGGAGGGWEAVDLGEIAFPPQFIITFTDELNEASSVFYFRYTTEDPTDTSGQQTPQNSLGSWAAPNEVYVKTTINSYTDPSQTTIDLDTSAAAPQESSGLAQIGPEIIKFGGFNSSGRQLSDVVRSIVPQSASTFRLEPYKDTVRYLLVSDLFDTGVGPSLEQYRCIVIAHESSDDLHVLGVKVHLVQNTSADVIVDIGIEVPSYDVRTGTLAESLTVGNVTFTSTDITGDITSGLFEDGHIIVDPSSSPKHAIISSFDVTGTTGEFILDRTLSATVAAGTDFRINAAPSQRAINDVTRPTENSNRFLGFLGEGGSNEIGFGSIRERNDRMNDFDHFYLWIKRTLTNNASQSNDTGAIVIVEYNETPRA